MLTQFTRADCSAENNVGSTCSFTCEDGYEVDSVSIECGNSGTWSGVTPVCKQIVEDKPVVKRPVKSKCDQIDSGILSLKACYSFSSSAHRANVFFIVLEWILPGLRVYLCLSKWVQDRWSEVDRLFEYVEVDAVYSARLVSSALDRSDIILYLVSIASD